MTYEIVQDVIGPAVLNGVSLTEVRELTSFLTGPGVGGSIDTRTFGRVDAFGFKMHAMRTTNVTSGTTNTQATDLSPYSLFPAG